MKLTVVYDESRAAILLPSGSCAGCESVCRKEAKTHYLPKQLLAATEFSTQGSRGDRLELGVKGPELRKLVFNSLMLPLLGFVSGVIMADTLLMFFDSNTGILVGTSTVYNGTNEFRDFLMLGCGMIGLAIGVVFCRPGTYNLIEFKKV